MIVRKRLLESLDTFLASLETISLCDDVSFFEIGIRDSCTAQGIDRDDAARRDEEIREDILRCLVRRPNTVMDRLIHSRYPTGQCGEQLRCRENAEDHKDSKEKFFWHKKGVMDKYAKRGQECFGEQKATKKEATIALDVRQNTSTFQKTNK